MLRKPWPRYRGHLSPPGLKLEKESENEFRRAGPKKSRKASRKRVKIDCFSTILTLFRLRLRHFLGPGASRPRELIFRLFFPTLGPEGPNDRCSRAKGNLTSSNDETAGFKQLSFPCSLFLSPHNARPRSPACCIRSRIAYANSGMPRKPGANRPGLAFIRVNKSARERIGRQNLSQKVPSKKGSLGVQTLPPGGAARWRHGGDKSEHVPRAEEPDVPVSYDSPGVARPGEGRLRVIGNAEVPAILFSPRTYRKNAHSKSANFEGRHSGGHLLGRPLLFTPEFLLEMTKIGPGRKEDF